ncbi:MAG: hypothetical protein WCB68_06535, partial [Pyrinomonadaceae bacterium]
QLETRGLPVRASQLMIRARPPPSTRSAATSRGHVRLIVWRTCYGTGAASTSRSSRPEAPSNCQPRFLPAGFRSVFLVPREREMLIIASPERDNRKFM